MSKCKEWWNIQLALGIWCASLSQHPLPPARHQSDPLTPSAQSINQEETENHEKRSNSQQILLCYLGLCSQNPGLREILAWCSHRWICDVRILSIWLKLHIYVEPVQCNFEVTMKK